MFRRLLVCVLVIATNAVYAQRFLTLPDFSALTTSQVGQLSVDPRTGFFYATSAASRLNGLSFFGAGRLSSDGIPDLSWRPAAQLYTGSAPVFSPNGNLYFVSQNSRGAIVSLSTMLGSEPVTRFTPPIPSEAGSNSRLLAIAGGYDQWLYFTVRESVGIVDTTRVGRLDTRNHLVDSWSYELPATSFASPAVGADGSIYVTTQSPDSGPLTRIFMRLSPNAPASLLWRREIQFARSRVEGDAKTRLYTMTGGAYGRPVEVMRLSFNGETDPTWSSQSVNQFLSRKLTARSVDMAVVGDGLIVTVTPDIAQGFASAEIARFDNAGTLQKQISVPGPASTGRYDSQPPFLGVANNGLHYTTGNTVWTFDASTLQTKNSFSYALGRPADIQKILALPDGGRLIFGQFDAIYSGRRYRNLIRTAADGNVVQDWQVNVEGAILDVFVTPRGVVVFGPFVTINGVAAPNGAVAINGYPGPSIALVSLAAGAAVDPAWGAQWPKTAFQVAYDGADRFFSASGFSGYASAFSLNALSLQNNAMSTDWAVPFRGESANFGTDRLGGLWLFWNVSGFGGSTVEAIERLDFTTRTQTANILINQNFFQTSTVQSSLQHGYIGGKRFALAPPGSEDLAWQRRPGSWDSGWLPQTLSASYLYWTQLTSQDNVNTLTVRRSLIAGTGDTDPNWLAPAPSSAAPFTVEVEAQSTDEIEYVSSQGVDVKLVTTRSLVSEEKTVIEYFNRDVQRYFLTGRTNEQAALDANPASFVRTGMKFAGRTALYYADQPDVPVCRFYAAPESGGSNTHFYGTGEDCPALNTVRQVRFEGFDFAAIKPTNGACPVTAPNPVYRLFNNKSATNEGNHRYVVSVATKSRMVALGWLDEGAVFCSVSVVDAVN